jgi:hypothetical protein
MFVCEQAEMTITGGRTECRRFLAGKRDLSLKGFIQALFLEV